MKHIVLTTVALILGACQGATTTTHTHPSDFPQLTVSATGQSTATPDTATITAGVLSRAKNPTDAMQINSQKMEAVFSALKNAGIERKNITTSNLALNPNYAYNRETGRNTIDGYQTSNQVTIRSEDISKVGAMVEALVSVGVNQVNNIKFTLKDPEGAREEARLEAISKARNKAETIAKAAGVELIKIRRISEGYTSSPSPSYDSCLLYTSPSPRDQRGARMPSSA